MNQETVKTYEELLKDNENLQSWLKVAVEALEFIGTYKHPDYFSISRGSVFEVCKRALEKINE